MSGEAQLGALAGAVLGGAYEVTRIIGEGGMGAVYEATHLRLNKRVAVKVMARELASNSEALARFRHEAEVTSHLGHPHLVGVIDFGTTASGEPYLVMEYLDGEDHDHRLRRQGRLPLETAVGITRQVASALAAAHDEGIAHLTAPSTSSLRHSRKLSPSGGQEGKSKEHGIHESDTTDLDPKRRGICRKQRPSCS